MFSALKRFSVQRESDAITRAFARCFKTTDGKIVLEHLHNQTLFRITEAFEVRLAAKAFSIHARILQTNFLAEMRAWQPNTPHNQDDALDAVAGAMLQFVPRYVGNTIYSIRTEDS